MSCTLLCPPEKYFLFQFLQTELSIFQERILLANSFLFLLVFLSKSRNREALCLKASLAMSHPTSPPFLVSFVSCIAT